MSNETLFMLVNNSVLPGWLLLAFAPRARVTRALVHAPVYPLVLGVAYALLLWTDRPGPQGASFFTLEGVTNIFTSPQTVIAAWGHYLIFDLFIGAWETRDAARRGIPHWCVVPSLALTLLFGPVGLLSYLVLRLALKRRWSLEES